MHRAIRDTWIGLVVAWMLGAGAGAQAPPPAETTAAPAVAVVRADSEDQGLVPPSTPVRRVVVFQNKGGHLLRLEVVARSCGCLEASISNSALRAGETSTMTLGTFSVPEPGPQHHQATLRVTWEEDGVERSQQIVVGLAYQSDVELVVMPKTALVAAVDGGSGCLDVFIRAARDGARPGLASGSVRLPGWTLERIENPTLPPEIQRWRAHGPAHGVGYHDAELTWSAVPGGPVVISASLRLHVLSRWRASPGGACFVIADPSRTAQQDVRLTPREQARGRPATAVLADECPFLTLALDRDGNDAVVHVTLAPSPVRSGIGSTRVRVLDDDGVVLADFPIAWYTPTAK